MRALHSMGLVFYALHVLPLGQPGGGTSNSIKVCSLSLANCACNLKKNVSFTKKLETDWRLDG